jgi:transcriptional regulator with XRE-family HTH domain
VATKARHLKTPVQLWIADNRKRLGLSSADLANLTGVSEDTARGWESRGAPAEDRLVLLEHRFGSPAPRHEASAGDQTALVEAIGDLVEEVRAEREERQRWQRAYVETLRAALAGQLSEELLDALVPPPLEGAAR